MISQWKRWYPGAGRRARRRDAARPPRRALRTSTRDNDGVPCANSGHSFHSDFTVTVPADGSWGRQCRTAAPAGMSLVLSSSPSSLAPCCLTIYHAFRYAPQDVRLRSVERATGCKCVAESGAARVRISVCSVRSVCPPLRASVLSCPNNVLTTVYGIVPRQDRDPRRARARPPRLSSQRARVSLHRQLVALRFVDGQ